MRAVFSVCMLLLLTTTVGLSIPQAGSSGSGTIFIKPDGSVDPPTAPIQRRGLSHIYIFADNIYEPIVIQRDNIVVDGDGYTLQGQGSQPGIYLYTRTKVTIKNVIIKGFNIGISLVSSYKNIISENKIACNNLGIELMDGSSSNTISENTIEDNDHGIETEYSCSSNVIRNNNIARNGIGIVLADEINTIVRDNNIARNGLGVDVVVCSNCRIYHNNIINNDRQAVSQILGPKEVNIWDNGYPSGGNYWSDYTGVDVVKGKNQDKKGSDGIGDTPYAIEVDMNIFPQQDRYPLMSPYKQAGA